MDGRGRAELRDVFSQWPAHVTELKASRCTIVKKCSTWSSSILEMLMYASDYPHSECRFPDSVDHGLAWSSLSDETQGKLMWGNATRLYKQT